jgi:outer membrane receptor protein involved in Fe transport
MIKATRRNSANAVVRSGASLIALSVAAAFAPSAMAQENEVVVTGSRIVRNGYSAPTPTTVLAIEEIQKTAPVNIANFVNQLPQLSATSTPRTGNAGTSGGTNGINSLNLRSLGTNRTLVLLDGQRVAPVSTNGATDINNLPTALIQRVDVVTGGASAAYGSDAVAGVVNFVLNKKFEGVKGSTTAGITSRNDDRTFNAEVAFGAPILAGRGHVLGSAEVAWTQGVDGIDPGKRDWFKQCDILSFAATARPQRIVACNANLRFVAQGGVITSGSAANTMFVGNGTPAPFVLGSPVDSLFMIGGNSWTEGNSVALEGAQRRRSFWGRTSYDITDSVTASIEGAYGFSRTSNTAAYQRFPGTGGSALVISSSNPYLDAATAARAGAGATFNYGYSSYDLGRPVNWAERESKRIVGSIDAQLPRGWTWNSYYQYGETNTRVELRNTTYGPSTGTGGRFREAIDAVRDPATGRIVCRSTLTAPGNGCVPLNIFGVGVASPEAIAYVKGVATQDLVLKQEVASTALSGDLFEGWAGPVSFATGAEYRKESITGTSDALSQANGWYTGNFKPTFGEFDVKEFFGELNVPLAMDAPFAKSLEFNAAARYTDYSLAGEVTTWKASLSYTPVDDLRLRAVRSRDIRAPNLGELFAAGATARQDVIDTTQASRPTVSVTRITSGNVGLTPEIADTTSFGAVLRPRFLPQFSASIDYYRIDISDAVATVNNQDTVDGCVRGDATLCALIVRNAGGTITAINGFPVNFATQFTSGIDYEASWRQDLGDLGALTLRALATNVRELYTVNGAVRDDQVGENSGNTPDWRWLASASYDWNRLSLTLQARGFTGGVYDRLWTSGVEIDNNDIKGAAYYQLSGSYLLRGEATGKKLVGFFNVENLLDRDPEIVATNAINGSGANSTLYDTIGRTYRVGIRFQY